MEFPHSLKFFEIPDHVRRPAGLFDADCKLGAFEEFRFQLLPAHRLSGMTGRRRLDFLQHLAVFEANGDAGVEVLEASILDLRIHYVPTTLRVTSRLGVDYEGVREFNDGIIYCSITGFGQTGPMHCARAST